MASDSGGPRSASEAGVVRLVGIRADALSVDRAMAAVADPRAGGTAIFVGAVRDHDGGRAVTELTYEGHPSAERVMAAIAADVASAPHVVAVAAEHRTGVLGIGDLAVVVAVSCAHRGDAFAAARVLIERIKGEVPIWKLQLFADGDTEWVACHADASVHATHLVQSDEGGAHVEPPVGRTLGE